MIHTSTSIVLRHQPYSNTSRIVHWLTADWGRIVTLVKGSQRTKSLFLGQFDSFYTCELVFYSRESRELFIARECAPLKTRDRFRSDWRSCALASYIADLAIKTAPAHAPQPRLFRLVDSTFDILAEQEATSTVLFWFELQLLDRLGLAPRLHHCLNCGKPIPAGARGCRFSDARGGVLCGTCAPSSTGAHRPIPPDVMAMLHAWQNARHPRTALATRPTADQAGRITALLGRFLSYHLDLLLPARAIALDMLRKSDQPHRPKKTPG